MSSNATASVVKAADDTWSNKAAAVDEITEAGLLDPNFSAESALWPLLKSGIYTTHLSGVSSGTGVGLIEVYEY